MSVGGTELLFEGFLQKRKDTLVSFKRLVFTCLIRTFLLLVLNVNSLSAYRRYDGQRIGSGFTIQPCSSIRRRMVVL